MPPTPPPPPPPHPNHIPLRPLPDSLVRLLIPLPPSLTVLHRPSSTLHRPLLQKPSNSPHRSPYSPTTHASPPRSTITLLRSLLTLPSHTSFSTYFATPFYIPPFPTYPCFHPTSSILHPPSLLFQSALHAVTLQCPSLPLRHFIHHHRTSHLHLPAVFTFLTPPSLSSNLIATILPHPSSGIFCSKFTPLESLYSMYINTLTSHFLLNASLQPHYSCIEVCH